MRVGSEEHSYNWIDNWAKIPESDSSRNGWAHPGIVATQSGNVLTSHPGEPEVMTFDGDGNLISSWRGDFAEAHGITLVNEDGSRFDLQNFHLRRETYEGAFRAAGFREFQWVDVSLDPAERGKPFWDDFMTHPPIVGELAFPIGLLS